MRTYEFECLVCGEITNIEVEALGGYNFSWDLPNVLDCGHEVTEKEKHDFPERIVDWYTDNDSL